MQAAAYPIQAEDVHEQIDDGEHDRRGLLHARVTPERPLAIILLHPYAALHRKVGEHVHARVFAIIRARPSREPQSERKKRLRLRVLLRVHRTRRRRGAIVVRGCGCAGLHDAFVETSPECVRAIPGRCVRGGGGTGGCDHEDQGERKKVHAHGAMLCLF